MRKERRKAGKYPSASRLKRKVQAVTLRGSRESNEDAHMAFSASNDALVLGVFDGHGGGMVSQFCSENFGELVEKYVLDEQEGGDGNNLNGGGGGCLMGLNRAFAEMSARLQHKGWSNDQGSTAVVAVINMGERPGDIYVANLGDAKALVFDANTGEIVAPYHELVFDAADKAAANGGTAAALPFSTGILAGRCETNDHCISGTPADMQDSRDKCGLRDLSLRKRRAAEVQAFVYASRSKDGRCWYVNEEGRLLEPTRSLGDRNVRSLIREPELHLWENATRSGCTAPSPRSDPAAFAAGGDNSSQAPPGPARHVLLMTCDGVYANAAFPTPDRLTLFLYSPDNYVLSDGWLAGTQIESLVGAAGVATILQESTVRGRIVALYSLMAPELPDRSWRRAMDETVKQLERICTATSTTTASLAHTPSKTATTPIPLQTMVAAGQRRSRGADTAGDQRRGSTERDLTCSVTEPGAGGGQGEAAGSSGPATGSDSTLARGGSVGINRDGSASTVTGGSGSSGLVPAAAPMESDGSQLGVAAKQRDRNGWRLPSANVDLKMALEAAAHMAILMGSDDNITLQGLFLGDKE